MADTDTVDLDPVGDAIRPKPKKDDAMTAAAAAQYIQQHGGFAGLSKSDVAGLLAAAKDSGIKDLPSEVTGDVPETFNAEGAATSVNGQSTAAPKDPGLATKPKAAAKPGASSAPGPAEQLMDTLVQQYQQAAAANEPYISGAAGNQQMANAEAIGQGIAGAGVQAPNAAMQGLIAGDASKVAQAQQAGNANITQALGDTGQADQAYLQASPYTALLSALQSEATYKAETAPTTGEGLSLPKGAPTGLTQAEATLAAGSAPTGLTTPKASSSSSSATSPSTDQSDSAGGGNG